MTTVDSWPHHTVSCFAPAKINLTLHVTGQRADGYHLLDTLVAFADVGDMLTLETRDDRSLSVTGPEAAGVPTDGGNLVLQVAANFWREGPLKQTLFKDLPAAAGIGGGSADAAACYRGVARLLAARSTDDDALLVSADAVRDLLDMGADIPMCVLSMPSRVRGIGEQIEPVSNFPSLPSVLVNPRVAIPTGAVFKGLGTKKNAPMPDTLPTFLGVADCVEWLKTCRNDLEPLAMLNVPAIAHVITALGDTGALMARMSGSGATCFGVFATQQQADAAAQAIATIHPNWWVRATILGDQSRAVEPRLS